MDSFSLQSSHINGFCRSNLNFGSNPLVIRANKLLGFDYYWKQRSIRWPNFSLKCRTFVEGIEGGVSSSTDGSKPVELHHEGNEELKGQLVGPVKPSSASIVRFHLFSQPANADDSNSKATGTLDLDEQVREQEVQEEDKDQDVQEIDDVEEHNCRVREAIDREGEDGSPAGVPSSVIPKQEVGNDSVVEDDFQEETVFEGEEKLLTKLKLSIVFVASEAAPYSKTGGLGDVCGSLPIALAARGHRVMVVSPRYMHGTAADKVYAGAFDANCRIKVNCFGGLQEVAFFHEYKNGVDWVFVDHYSYHRPGNPYGDSHGAFGDNQFRFTLLCHAACEAPLVLPLGGYTYGDNCLFLVNDWHAGLVPVLLAAKYRPYGVYKAARSVLVIHNLSHQGVEPGVTYDNLGLPSHWYGALEWVFPEWARAHELDKGEAVNILKGAIVTADRILTVSQGYSWEITTVEGGYGLHELLTNRKFVLNGIINGINVDEWNPSNDPLIAAPYNVDDLSGKAECKAALQKELGLPIKPDCPLIGFIGRLDYQKGIDIIQEAFPQLMGDDVQFVMLGSGDARYERWMRAAEGACKDKFRGWVGFNIPISHKITAGCDILLMPSRFEPCGLNQLYAMRYGTIPVVHATGGLRLGLFSIGEGEYVGGSEKCNKNIQGLQGVMGRVDEERDATRFYMGYCCFSV
ncbi:starch synthase 1, chloroplastic/amyloplastic-like isoform X2 [Amaranthus tricolor]|uniref:starch synthase 1, chloroplastic/amyloplastic-like isoform X2 n=1 Tax=Amaranthus tricolor TaxID=29722 RepID=UPI00258656B6|nr:starch synthase 1, chloroplastic/amyloplastic-like isoform X2 [Amaranthus tricolor]